MSPRYKWYAVAMLWWIAFFNYADRQAIFSVFPLLQKEMGLTTLQLGLLGSSFALVYGLCSPFAGSVVDRVRRKSAILGGLHTWSAICMATAVSRNLTTLLAFRAAEGLGETFYFPASVSLLSDYHGPATRSRALGFHQTAVYFGTIAGGFFAGAIAQSYGWRWSFLVFGGCGVALGLMLRKLLVEPRRGGAECPVAKPAAHMPMREFLRVVGRTPAAILLMGAFVCANFVAMVLLSWMPKYLYDQFHLSLAAAGLTATVYIQLAAMAGASLGGWLADVLHRMTPGGRMLVQAAGVLGGAPSVVLCALTRSTFWLVVALTAWGLCKGLYDANIFASLFDVIPPETRGTAAGFMNMAGWLGGGASAPVVIGYLAGRESLSAAIATAAIVYVAAGALLIAAARITRVRQRGAGGNACQL